MPPSAGVDGRNRSWETIDNHFPTRYNPTMSEHDVLYHEVLEALQAGGCPLCRLARRAGDSYLHALIYEGITDPGLRDELRDTLGPCFRHGWRMANQRWRGAGYGDPLP